MKRKLNLLCILLSVFLTLGACSTRQANLQEDASGPDVSDSAGFGDSKAQESADANEKIKPSESLQPPAPLKSTSAQHQGQGEKPLSSGSRQDGLPDESPGVQSGEEMISDHSISVQAGLLTDHIVHYMLDPNIVNNAADIDDYAIYRFIVSLLMYTDNSNHPYSGIVTVKEDGYAYFPLDKVQQVADEVFGKRNWFFENSDFNEESQGYQLMTGFGIGGTYSYKDLNIKIGNDAIAGARFILTSSDGEELGSYLISYQILSENDRTFLRYLSFEKIE